MDDQKNTKAVREWIIFALCLGLGAHVTLGLVIHDAESWPAQTSGLYGILVSLSLYVFVQLIRSVWWIVRGETKEESIE